MEKNLIIIGAGRGVDVVLGWLKLEREKLEIWGVPGESMNVLIVDDDPKKERFTDLMGTAHPVHHSVSKMVNEFDPTDTMLALSMSNMPGRRKIFAEYSPEFNFANVGLGDYSVLFWGLGAGCSNTLFRGIIFEAGATIGDNNVISSGCVINHHCKIGSGNLFGPGCLLSGSVTIRDNCTIGSGVIFQPRVVVGNNVTIPSGCVVVRSIPDNTAIKIKSPLGSPVYPPHYKRGNRIE